ncbi:MAG: AraC family transcriptional regulator [Cereibacter sphaeroides]|uniref:AraC family transcriptional regulator n=1 Tax=Cereibacter sphaeroides TaxID=1063 RepID=A0A2W5U3K9_CERSP|nr:MAG: AraC family transcriptional regulator [Cereibacter sphaeroides]
MSKGLEKRILRMLDYIYANPAGDLSLDALAEVAAMSRFHWHRVYRATTGETVAQTVRRMRMHRAAMALIHSETDLAGIAAMVGYPNVTSFSHTFRELYSVSPSAFRKRGDLRPFLPPLRNGETLMYDVIIRTDPPRRLAAMPHEGAYLRINLAFEKLGATLGARGLTGRIGKMVGVYYEDPSAKPENELRSHAGVEVGEDFPIEAPLEEVRLPGGRTAVLTFTGPYAGLPAAYDQLYSIWLPDSGEEPAHSPAFEVYLNTPMDTPPHALKTEICLPLK